MPQNNFQTTTTMNNTKHKKGSLAEALHKIHVRSNRTAWKKENAKRKAMKQLPLPYNPQRTYWI